MSESTDDLFMARTLPVARALVYAVALIVLAAANVDLVEMSTRRVKDRRVSVDAGL